MIDEIIATEPAAVMPGAGALPCANAHAVLAVISYLEYWGKAQPTDDCRVPWHPAAYHCLDVAAVFERLLIQQPALARSLAGIAGTQAGDAARLLTRLAALHDIGKFSVGFQSKVPSYFPPALGAVPAIGPVGDHTRIGHHLFWHELAAELGALAPQIDDFGWAPLLSAIVGHHGRPVSDARLDGRDIGPMAIEAARGFLSDAVAAVGTGEFGGSLDERSARLLSWRLAGLTTLADWIGSNQAIFRYERPERDLPAYLEEIARPRAVEAVRAAGISRPMVSGASGLAALAGRSLTASPLQAFTETVELPTEGPALILVEDVTGAGKTEAALILAHRLMQLGIADGIFVALPTMATANAMYDHLSTLYRRLFAPQADPSLVLAHGARGFHPGFRASIVAVGREEKRLGPGDDDLTASAACAAWIADDRRKAFFADVGVGTIDQALLAVLPAKFAPLRLCGLSRRVLIVDEAHAYDAYMGEELGRLVQFHAAQGGATVILSATLPETAKDGLVRAFRSGVGRRHPPTPWSPAYPQVSILGADGAVAGTALETRPDLPRRLPVRRLADAEAACAEIEAAARTGATVAYVRNTVDDALAAYEALAARDLDVTLFHARFAMCDRLAIEQAVVAAFGRSSTAADRQGRRGGKVLVATQVVEQSLDLDFDFMVADLAPIDLIIQRAGRLWRHMRNDRPCAAARLGIVSPDPTADAGVDWYRSSFPKAAYVYENHALLWQTANVLFEAGAIESPAGVRPLVEAVYGKGALEAVPRALEGRRNAAEGRASAEKSHARLNLLDLEVGYDVSNGAWDSDTRTPTRLGDARTILRLARITGTAARPTLLPWADVTPEPNESHRQALRRAWSLSEVSVAAWRIAGRGACNPAVEAAALAIEAEWREVGDEAIVVPLARGGTTEMCGRCLSQAGGGVTIRYNSKVGLILTPA